MSDRVIAITRSFQPNKTFETFEQDKFDQGLATSVRQLLATRPSELAGIIVVSCGDQSSSAKEQVINSGDKDKIATPTTAAVQRAFPDEVSSGFIQTIVCEDWGQNYGSATALNEGVSLARSLGATHHLMWSAAEIRLTGHQLCEMIEHSYRFDLKLTGFARNGWSERRQWLFVQNTIALWNDELLTSVNGFNRCCNGDGVTTVETKEFGAVPLAGMEDYHLYLRACILNGAPIPWGFVGTRHPVKWDTSAKLPGSPEYERNVEKIARQALVMDAYAQALFSDKHPIEVWRDVMSAVKIG
ncbi:MAG: hypothetical protein WA082_03525 [Candidatus Moraniibacteriota bacterium]